MPWKGESDPYRIWISEIILQQTRVEQGLNYYNRFITTLPNIESLAKAPESKVFKLWEGLGYYSRCKNLISAARIINSKYKKNIPDNYEQILDLPGIGPYTASAIASFAFNLPHAVVDGNVFRVLSRFFGIHTAVDTSLAKKQYTQLANELLDKKQPGLHNQAIMDLGAVICKPRQPDCKQCPLKKHCVAFTEELVDQLPVKGKKNDRVTRWFYYLVIRHKDKIYLHKRTAKDIWQNLHEFVLVESVKELTKKALQDLNFINQWPIKKQVKLTRISDAYAQQLSHLDIKGRIVEISLSKEMTIEGYKAISVSRISKLAFPKVLADYLKANPVS